MDLPGVELASDLLYPVFRIILSTLARVTSETSGLPFITFDAVAMDTPASLAMSASFIVRGDDIISFFCRMLLTTVYRNFRIGAR